MYNRVFFKVIMITIMIITNKSRNKRKLTGWPYIMVLTLSFFFNVKILVFFDEILEKYISEYAL